MPLQAEKSANTSLNKAAVNAQTPYIVLGMGCFWGSEKRMQELKGVLDVEAGYAGGDIAHPSYETLHDTEADIQQGKAIKNHAEVVKVFFDPKQTDLEQVLIQFWENHNPTQGNRQGNDVGSNYRSAIFYQNDQERQLAEKTKAVYQQRLQAAGYNKTITTEIAPLVNYTPAEDYHQDYLQKNPRGYCGLGGLNISYREPPAAKADFTPMSRDKADSKTSWQNVKLNPQAQLIVFGAETCPYCKAFEKEILSSWKQTMPIHYTYSQNPPANWTLKGELEGTPTIVYFKDRQEVARYTGYRGTDDFWSWYKKAVPNN